MRKNVLFPVGSLVLALILGLGLTVFFGENPFQVFLTLIRGSMGSWNNVGYSLFYSTPLIFTGLSVAWANRAGLFNIGAEGQMAMGGLAMGVSAIYFPQLPFPFGIIALMFIGFFAGGLWGAIAGWMKAYRGCHEVLVTMMLNFISAGLTSFFILSLFKNPLSQAPETIPVPDIFHLPQWTFFEGSPINYAFFFGIIFCVFFAFIFRKTVFGFKQRLVGGNSEVARFAGHNVSVQMILAMFFAGGLAGLAGMSQIFGSIYKVREGFTAGAGFIGIAVALLGRNSAGGIFAAALLFGFLHKGSLDLDLDTKFITRDLAVVIQAIIVLVIVSEPGLRNFFKERTLKARLWKK